LVPPRDLTVAPMSRQGDASPLGAIGPTSDRGAGGRFIAGNRAALVTGERSTQFWRAAEAARRESRDAIIRDAGHTSQDAPEALRVTAEGLAQAVLLRDSAFARVIESGGPLTSSGRTRRAFAVWTAAADRVERYARLVGVRRVPQQVNVAERLAQMHEERER
jgi:hypothetical protein